MCPAQLLEQFLDRLRFDWIMNGFDAPTDVIHLVPLNEPTRLCFTYDWLQKSTWMPEDSSLRRRCKFVSIGLGSLFCTATMINSIWTTSEAPTNSGRIPSKTSHVWRSTLSGSYASGGHWSKETSSRLTSLLKEVFGRDLGARYCVKLVLNQNSQAE